MRQRLYLITGHYGSGKTEIAVNLAARFASQGPTTLVDMDIVNPYFCSREAESLLTGLGVRVILPAERGRADLPALPADILSVFANEAVTAVFDVGGDPAGARALSSYADRLRPLSPAMYCVVNANRPETRTAERAASYLREIESASRLTVTGLVSNTHLLEKTSLSDLDAGDALCREIAALTGVPLVFHAAPKGLLAEAEKRYREPVLGLELYMKKPWETEM